MNDVRGIVFIGWMGPGEKIDIEKNSEAGPQSAVYAQGLTLWYADVADIKQRQRAVGLSVVVVQDEMRCALLQLRT